MERGERSVLTLGSLCLPGIGIQREYNNFWSDKPKYWISLYTLQLDGKDRSYLLLSSFHWFKVLFFYTFTRYPEYNRVSAQPGARDSISHAPPDFRDITKWMAELNQSGIGSGNENNSFPWLEFEPTTVCSLPALR